MRSELEIKEQWSDFLVRRLDPYALSKYEILLQWMGDVKDKSVVVVGCGSGEFPAFLALRGAEVEAFDIEERNVQLTVETAQRLNTHFKTFVATIENVSTEKKYDYVVATDVIEHIADHENAVARLKELTKPDGHLILTVPALNSLMGYHDEILGHYRRYSAESLRDLLNPFFTVSKLRYFGFTLIPVTFLLSCLLRRRYPVAVVGQMKESNSLGGKIVRLFFRMEQKLNFGLGTSLLVCAKPR